MNFSKPHMLVYVSCTFISCSISICQEKNWKHAPKEEKNWNNWFVKKSMGGTKFEN